jgi:hypothetical protein
MNFEDIFQILSGLHEENERNDWFHDAIYRPERQLRAHKMKE